MNEGVSVAKFRDDGSLITALHTEMIQALRPGDSVKYVRHDGVTAEGTVKFKEPETAWVKTAYDGWALVSPFNVVSIRIASAAT